MTTTNQPRGRSASSSSARGSSRDLAVSPPSRARRGPREVAGGRRRPSALGEGPAPVGATRAAAGGCDDAPDLLITSPRVRAVETADLVAEALGVGIVVDPRLAGPLDADVLTEILLAAGPAGRPCLVGHDPDFSGCLARCRGSRLAMRKGAIARVDFGGRVVVAGRACCGSWCRRSCWARSRAGGRYLPSHPASAHDMLHRRARRDDLGRQVRASGGPLWGSTQIACTGSV